MENTVCDPLYPLRCERKHSHRIAGHMVPVSYGPLQWFPHSVLRASCPACFPALSAPPTVD